jgi:hypothetical protein
MMSPFEAGEVRYFRRESGERYTLSSFVSPIEIARRGAAEKFPARAPPPVLRAGGGRF